MEICHLFLECPWKYDLKAKHNGVTNKYQISNDGHKYNLLPNPDPHQEKPREELVIMVGEQEMMNTI